MRRSCRSGSAGVDCAQTRIVAREAGDRGQQAELGEQGRVDGAQGERHRKRRARPDHGRLLGVIDVVPANVMTADTDIGDGDQERGPRRA